VGKLFSITQVLGTNWRHTRFWLYCRDCHHALTLAYKLCRDSPWQWSCKCFCLPVGFHFSLQLSLQYILHVTYVCDNRGKPSYESVDAIGVCHKYPQGEKKSGSWSVILKVSLPYQLLLYQECSCHFKCQRWQPVLGEQ